MRNFTQIQLFLQDIWEIFRIHEPKRKEENYPLFSFNKTKNNPSAIKT